MTLAPGTRLGPYEILAPLGAGGMGEVYRARDARLNRDVAIKALPDLFAADKDRVMRFDYEMLSGRRAFDGDDVADVVAAILRGEPDWTALPADVPAYVRPVIQRCLVKDRKARIPDMAVVRFMFDELSPIAATPSSAALGVASSRRRALALAGAAVAVVAFAIAVTWTVMRRSTESTPSPVRFAIDVPALAGNRAVVISADGQRIVYASGSAGSRELLVRRIDRLEAEPLRGTANGYAPFLSPDGKWIGYFHGTTELRRIPIDGGPPVKICQISGVQRGAAWADDDTIVFSAPANNTVAGLMSVSAAGGTPKPLTKPDGALDFGHVNPSMLPDGRGVLFGILNSAFQSTQIALLDLKTGAWQTLRRGGSRPQYVSSGHLLYGAAGSVHAARFDLERLTILGEPVQVLNGVMGGFDVSTNGTLVYLPEQVSARSLVWVDRQGREEPTGAPARAYLALRLAPDGTRVTLDIRDQEDDVWVWDLARRTMQKLTFGPALDMFPVWTPDSRRIVFTSGRTGTHDLYWQAADGSAAAEPLTKATNIHTATSIAPDASLVLLTEAGEQGDDIMVLPLDAKRQIQPLVRTPFRERNAAVSPDGRWVAYESDESGALQVFVRPFPEIEAGRWLVSPRGGAKPSWSRNGRELFYVDSANALVSVRIETIPAFRAGDPVRLFDLTSGGTLTNGRQYDVTPDGHRFIVIKEAPPEATVSKVPQIVVVLNWLSEMQGKSKAP